LPLRRVGLATKLSGAAIRIENPSLKESPPVFALIALLGTVVIVTLLNAIEFGRGD